jgi:hypothetical protein
MAVVVLASALVITTMHLAWSGNIDGARAYRVKAIFKLVVYSPGPSYRRPLVPGSRRKLDKRWWNYADFNGVIQPDTTTLYSRLVIGSKY